MIFFDLVQKYTWPDFESVFLQLHPRENHALAITTFANAYGELRHLEPEASNRCIKIEDRIDKNGQHYTDVFGTEVLQSAEHLGVESVEQYGLDFVMWPEWLGMEVDEGTLAEYGEEAILSLCLYEMTFYGYTLNEIVECRDRVVNTSPYRR